jgi:hypothetical protein
LILLFIFLEREKGKAMPDHCDNGGYVYCFGCGSRHWWEDPCMNCPEPEPVVNDDLLDIGGGAFVTCSCGKVFWSEDWCPNCEGVDIPIEKPMLTMIEPVIIDLGINDGICPLCNSLLDHSGNCACWNLDE